MTDQPSYKGIYPLLDPIIKEFPTITHEELKEGHPDIGNNITRWSFLARRKKLSGESGYGNKVEGSEVEETEGDKLMGPLEVDKPEPKKKRRAKRRVKRKYNRRKEIPKEVKVLKSTTAPKDISEEQIAEFIEKTHPTSKRHKVYQMIGKVLLKEPNLAYSVLAERRKVNLSNPSYYAFRKEFNIHFSSVKTTEKGSNDKRPYKKSDPVKRNGSSKRGVIYTTEWETEIGHPDETIEVVKDIFKTLRENKRMNLEVIELKVGFEVRSFTK